MKKIISYIIIAIFGIVLIGCNKKEYTLDLTAESTTVKVGEAIELIPVTNMPKAVFVWSSSHPEIADVEEDGWVYGISEGTATITVTVEKVGSKTIVITVIKDEEPPQPPKEYTPTELKGLLSDVLTAYGEATNGSVTIEAGKGTEVLTSDLVFNFTSEKRITSLMYKLSGTDTAHVYVKEGYAYMLRNELKTKSEMTLTEETTIVNSYGFNKFASAITLYYNETEFFTALSFVSRVDNVLTYTLDLSTYAGSVFDTEGKDSITIKVYLVDEEVVRVDTLIKVGEDENFTKIHFKGLGVQTISFPFDLDTYNEE